jgi:transposase
MPVSRARSRRADAPRRPRRYPSSLTDAQWTLLQPRLVSPLGRRGRPRKHPLRAIVDAIFYLVRGGIAWRMLPADFPPWQTVYWWYARWSADDTWRWVHDRLRDRLRVSTGRFPQPTAAVIDSQSVRAAETVGRASRGFDGAKKVNGRKRHIAVDTSGLLLAVIVTAASITDRDGGLRLLCRLREYFCNLELVWADSAYAGRLVTLADRVLWLTLHIVKRTDPHRFTVLPRRWVVERTLAWITRNRRLARDYERQPIHHEAMVYIAMIMLMTRRLAPC